MKDRSIANQIATIRGLRMVHFYHLYDGEDANGVVCGILAYYQDQVINLCSGDEQFNALFERIARVYDREKQTAEIYADEETRRILERANAFREDGFEYRLGGYERMETPMMLPKAFCVVYLLPMIRHVVESIYCGADPVTVEEGSTKIKFDWLPRVWFGKGILNAMSGEKHLHFPYQIFPSAGECYDIVVRNVLSDGNALKIEITYGYDRITLSYYDSHYLYEGSLQYTCKGGRGSIAHELRQKGESIFVTETECPAIEGVIPAERILQFTGVDTGEWSAHRLPWGDAVCYASVNGTEYRVMISEENDLTVSYLLCFRYLNSEGEAPLAFGEYSFRLYERPDISELHMLEMEQPGSGRFQERYSGRFYK